MACRGAAEFAAFDAVGGIVSHGTSQDEGGAGIRLLALAQQQTLAAFFTLDPTIQDPGDFTGRSIAVVPGGGTALLLPTWLEQEGVDPDSVEVLHAPPPELVGLLAQETVDIIDQYVVGVPLVRQATDGQTPTVFPIGDTLPDALGVGIWASADIAEEDPNLCIQLRDATLKGLAYALEHPEEAGRILHDVEPSADPDTAAEELQLMQPYTLTPTGTPLGAVNLAQMTRAIGLLEAVGAIPAGTTPDQLTDPAVTLGLDGDL